jgi:hypothetical protein
MYPQVHPLNFVPDDKTCSYFPVVLKWDTHGAWYHTPGSQGGSGPSKFWLSAAILTFVSKLCTE